MLSYDEHLLYGNILFLNWIEFELKIPVDGSKSEALAAFRYKLDAGYRCLRNNRHRLWRYWMHAAISNTRNRFQIYKPSPYWCHGARNNEGGYNPRITISGRRCVVSSAGRAIWQLLQLYAGVAMEMPIVKRAFAGIKRFDKINKGNFYLCSTINGPLLAYHLKNCLKVPVWYQQWPFAGKS